MEKHELKGTIRLYGTPAEETLIGKVYMTLAGAFDDLDVCLHWHPGRQERCLVRQLQGAGLGQVHVPGHGRPTPRSARTAAAAPWTPSS